MLIGLKSCLLGLFLICFMSRGHAAEGNELLLEAQKAFSEKNIAKVSELLPEILESGIYSYDPGTGKRRTPYGWNPHMLWKIGREAVPFLYEVHEPLDRLEVFDPEGKELIQWMERVKKPFLYRRNEDYMECSSFEFVTSVLSADLDIGLKYVRAALEETHITKKGVVYAKLTGTNEMAYDHRVCDNVVEQIMYHYFRKRACMEPVFEVGETPFRQGVTAADWFEGMRLKMIDWIDSGEARKYFSQCAYVALRPETEGGEMTAWKDPLIEFKNGSSYELVNLDPESYRFSIWGWTPVNVGRNGKRLTLKGNSYYRDHGKDKHVYTYVSFEAKPLQRIYVLMSSKKVVSYDLSLVP